MRKTSVLFAMMALLPILVFSLNAFSARWFYPQLLPTEWTLEPFLRVMNDPRTSRAVTNGLGVATLVTVASLVLSFPAARALTLHVLRGREAITLMLLLPTVLPPIAIGMGLNTLFLQLELTGTIFGVALAHVVPVLPYTITTLVGVFARFDANYERQATVLGAPPLQMLLQVTLPMVLPGVVVAALFAFLGSWSQYLLTLLIGGGQVLTLPMLLFAATSGSNPTLIASLALLFLLPPLLAIAFAARQLMSHEADMHMSV